MFKNIAELNKILESCRLCPRNCSVNRKKKELGYCKASDEICIASNNLHFGEEPPISGERGSGTIFFSHCNLGCVYCQNYPISHLGNGNVFSIQELSHIMLKLEDRGAHNINFVTPTHYAAQMAEAIDISKKDGLKIPIVYNCGGYEPEEVIDRLDGIVDIYMTDMKYGFNEISQKYSNVKDYVDVNVRAVKKMFEQVGCLKLDENGIANKGLIVRHMMLPGNIENTFKVLDYLGEISNEIHLSFMAQYHPAYRFADFPELTRRLTSDEYKVGVDYLEKKGFENGWIQELE